MANFLAGKAVAVTGGGRGIGRAVALAAAAEGARVLTFLLVPMDQPGRIEVRPIRQLTGTGEFHEVFFDGATARAEHVVGGEGNGWGVAMSLLGFERGVSTLAQQIGLGARIAGASRIVAVDANPAKEAVAGRFGATDFLTSTDDMKDVLPTGADHAFECVGRVELIRAAIDALDRHGQAVLLGVPPATAEASFLVSSMYLDKAVLGCRYGSSRPQRYIAHYARMYREGRLLLDELVTATYPVEDYEKAAADAHAGRVARAVLTF